MPALLLIVNKLSQYSLKITRLAIDFPKSLGQNYNSNMREKNPYINSQHFIRETYIYWRKKKGEKGRHLKDGYSNKRAKGSFKSTNKRRKHQKKQMTLEETSIQSLFVELFLLFLLTPRLLLIQAELEQLKDMLRS